MVAILQHCQKGGFRDAKAYSDHSTPNVSSIDGIRLDKFVQGGLYTVAASLGCVFVAEGWAVPAGANDPAGNVLLRHMDWRVFRRI
jgi:hypothetical protein